MVAQSSRPGSGGALLYDFEYELSSTRGRKRILNTVTIYDSKLFIVNANAKCGKEACSEENEATVALLRSVARSFDVLS